MSYATEVGQLVISADYDSNGRFGSGPVSGHMSGLYREIIRRWGNSRIWRSGIVPGTWPSSPGTVGIGMTDANANGDSWVQSAYGSGAQQWNTSGGDSFDEAQAPSSINIINGSQYRYIRWAPTNTPTLYSFTGTNVTQEYRAQPGTKWAANGFVGRGHMTFKKINGGGTIRLNVHGHTGSSTLFGFNAAESLNNGGAAELYRRSVDYTVTQSGIGVAIEPCAREQIFGTSDATTLSGEIVAYSRCFSDPAATRGFCVDLFCALGGQSMREMAIYTGSTDNGSTGLVGNTATSLRNRIDEQMALVSASLTSQRMLCIAGFGLNDRNETETSCGSPSVADGDSPEAYAANLRAYLANKDTAWAASGRPLSNLSYLIHVGHALSPDDAEMASYFQAAESVVSGAQFRDRITLLDHRAGLSGAQMLRSGFYDGAGQEHLNNTTAYPALWRAWTDVLLGEGGRRFNRVYRNRRSFRQ